MGTGGGHRGALTTAAGGVGAHIRGAVRVWDLWRAMCMVPARWGEEEEAVPAVLTRGRWLLLKPRRLVLGGRGLPGARLWH